LKQKGNAFRRFRNALHEQAASMIYDLKADASAISTDDRL